MNMGSNTDLDFMLFTFYTVLISAIHLKLDNYYVSHSFMIKSISATDLKSDGWDQLLHPAITTGNPIRYNTFG
jgi:hypothetical protein